MNSENNPNASASATTSPTAPPRPHPPTPEKADEADYITRQQEQARAAISGVIADMKQALAQGADVKDWARRYPWILAGGAVAAGFAVALLATPSKKEPFEEFWNSIKDKITPPPAGTTPSGVVPPVVPAEKPSMLGALIREAMKAAGPIIGGIITQRVAGEPKDGDGHPHDNPRDPAYAQSDQPATASDV